MCSDDRLSTVKNHKAARGQRSHTTNLIGNRIFRFSNLKHFLCTNIYCFFKYSWITVFLLHLLILLWTYDKFVFYSNHENSLDITFLLFYFHHRFIFYKQNRGKRLSNAASKATMRTHWNKELEENKIFLQSQRFI